MQNKTPPSLHQKTAAAWDVTAAIYERDEAEVVEKLTTGGTTLLKPEVELLQPRISDVRRAIHLQCAGGADTLSLWKLGAAEVVGVDISPRMIASAERKSKALNAPASWHCCDILQTPPDLNGTADLVYTGRGALPWILDLDAWAAVVHRLLRSGGSLFIFEGHPLDWVWESDATELQLANARSYFDGAPIPTPRWPTPFIQNVPGTEEKPQAYERQWTLGQIFDALLQRGFSVKHFQEYAEPFWNQFPHLPRETLHRLPHTFSLLAQKSNA